MTWEILLSMALSFAGGYFYPQDPVYIDTAAKIPYKPDEKIYQLKNDDFKYTNKKMCMEYKKFEDYTSYTILTESELSACIKQVNLYNQKIEENKK